MKIAVIGSGYVGLVSGACFCEFGTQVVCVDKDDTKIQNLKQGKIPIFEPGLEDLVTKGIHNQRLSFTTDLAAALQDADVVFIAVGTPSRRGDGHADLSYVFDVAREIAPHLKKYTVVVTKSTVPVGTGRQVENIIRTTNSGASFSVVSNPEFLREGSAIEDFMRPDRVVIGSQDERAKEVMKRLYRPLYLLETPIVFTNLETAELIKYAANAFLATKIAFINEISSLCEACGADVGEVAKGIGLDRRIGNKFLHTGPGYGGSCFPKDTLALVRTAQEHNTPLSIVESVVKSNDKRKVAMVDLIRKAFGGELKGKKIAILGVTFKPNTDDMREAPSLVILPALQQEGALLSAYDPEGRHEAEKFLSNIDWAENPYSAMENADGIVILTEWNEFRQLDLEKVKSLLKEPLMVDLRNIYPLSEMEGFSYISLGRKALTGKS